MKSRFLIIALLVVSLGCRRSEHATNASKGNDPAGPVLTSITFEVDDPQSKSGGPSPYINLADPEKDLKRMRKPDEVVVTGTELLVVLDYPLRKDFTFPINASSTNGFTRAELVRKIAGLYKTVYEEEAQTSKIAVVPLDQRKGLINRNKTNGKYGIWGHDLSDLDLHTVEISRKPDGTFVANLGIDS